ncbi:MAG: hypothetical protein M1834_005682 [Cirrosporium novae-zelandiae]|nr:MAG: hypothetical protein M1834_005682 [Cirrosporium novae-zelandiae]
MGIFRSLKGNFPSHIGGDSSSSTSQYSTQNEKNRVFSSSTTQETFSPPLRPPPSHQTFYEPPPGPPPSHSTNDTSNQAPYHDWTSIPDTALLPPPPSVGYDTSPSGNASHSAAQAAEDWCRVTPLYNPSQPSPQVYDSIRQNDVRLAAPREFSGDIKYQRAGVYKCSTHSGAGDSCIVSSLPVYFALADTPFNTEVTKTIYFEVRIRSLGRPKHRDDCAVAIGFLSQPYPTWRLPGWERASLGVHGDDGRRYVNDPWGGKNFTDPFNVGETVGVGMRFHLPLEPPLYNEKEGERRKAKVEVFFTRDGREDGGWNLDEELDQKLDRGPDGLQGDFDLYAAIGVFGKVEFEAIFNSTEWLYRP